jgi:ribosomal protein S18 acetylase RimI-like enzyme
MQPITIREVMPEDAEELARVTEVAWLATYVNEKYGITREDILAIGFTTPERVTQKRKGLVNLTISRQLTNEWVASNGDAVVGFCRAGRAEESWIRAIYILPKFQRKGIGKALLETAEKWINETHHGKKPIFLSVAVYNENAIRFYRKHGYKETGRPVSSEVSKLSSGKIIPEIEMAKPPASKGQVPRGT